MFKDNRDGVQFFERNSCAQNKLSLHDHFYITDSESEFENDLEKRRDNFPEKVRVNVISMVDIRATIDTNIDVYDLL
jgi:hypothetical protein